MLHRLFLTACAVLLLTISAPAYATVITATGGFNIAAVAGVAFTDTVATFTDSNSAAKPTDFTATIDWGDSTTSAGAISLSGSTFSVTGTHTYAGAGTYTVTVTVSDVPPGTATAMVTDTATVSAGAPTVTKTFSTPFGPLNPGDMATLNLNITNPNPIPLTGVAFTDTLPTGLVISTPNGLTSSGCGMSASITATAGTNMLSLSNGTIAPMGTCSISVSVTNQTFNGPLTNPAIKVTSIEAPSGMSVPVTLNQNFLFFYWFFAES
jgi:uncharacterized repeat protein (TIGR01451 family)